jgi:beta-lactam-binding protein with PASTA domain
VIVAVVVLVIAAAARADGRAPPRTVVVPKVTSSLDLRAAYTRLAKAGLRMAIPQAFSLRSLCLPTARSQSPVAGRHVLRGATVSVRGLTCFLGSPAGGSQQAVVVPDFTGRTASSAVSWAERNHLYWQLDRLPALRPSTRKTLLDNYVVTSQQPAPGALLARGMPCPGVASGCFIPTPLTMRARTHR